MKGRHFYKEKNRTCEKPRMFSNFYRFIDELGIFNSDEFENNYSDIYRNELELKMKNQDLCKAKSMVENLPWSCLIENRVLSISITCPIWIVIYHLKYEMLQLVLKFYVLSGR